MVEGARTAVVIDDDPDIRMLLRMALETTGFVVDEAMTGHGGVERVRALKPDLVTLDLVLPGFGGIEVCRRIRQISDAYIIMITASSDEADRLVGLATGADDYVTKPFSPREVQARVAAMFRRPRAIPTGTGPVTGSADLVAPALPAPPELSFGPPVPDQPATRAAVPGIPASRSPEPAHRALSAHSAPSAGPGPSVGPAGSPGPVGPVGPVDEHGILRHGGVAVDPEARVAWFGPAELPLTKIEFDLLVTLVSNPRRVWRRETLLNIVWGGQWSDFHVVEVHIGNLRRKLADAGPDGSALIKTVRGIGYRMTQSDSPPPAASLPSPGSSTTA